MVRRVRAQPPPETRSARARIKGRRFSLLELGIVLLAVGAALLVAEAHLPTFGALGVAGVAALATGVAVALDAAGGGLALALSVAIAVGLGGGALLLYAVRASIQRDYDAQSRRKLKKVLLDALDAKYGFELPPSLVEQEFAAVWSQVVGDMKSNNRTFEDESTTEDEAKAEYRKIAERRVRLGLVLAQIGEKTDIKISDDEVTQALIERVRQYPGQERQVWEFYQKNPQALAEIRAPLFEEKVVDQILSQVKVDEETVSKDALFSDEDEDGEKAGKGE